MASNILPPFPSFSVHEDNSSVGSRWKKWFKRFEMYLAAHDVKDPTRKRALLLYSAGEEVSDIFETLSNQGEEKDYQAAVDALNAYFQPQVNKTFEVYKFRNATQDPGKPLDSYHTRLRRLAQLCEFTDEEEEIKSHIILTCSSSRLRCRALRENMNLKAILDYARGLEMAERHAQGIEDKNKVCKVKAKPAQASNTRNNDNLSTSVKKKCYRCGGDFPHQGRPCPALHVSCRNCRKIGHFAKVCRSTPAGPKVNATNEKESDESSDEEYAYGVTINSVKSKKYPTSKVTIRNKTVEFLIDSGAGVNIMDSETYNNINLPLQDTSKKIFGYNADSPLPVLGKFSASVTSKVTNTSADVQFYVIQGGEGNLMSYQTATDLGLLHIVNSVSSSEASTNIIKQYDDRFHDLGKMKGKAAKLYINKDVKPLAQKHRRVPFNLQDQVEAEIRKIDAYVNFVTVNALPDAVSLQEIQNETLKDKTLQCLSEVLLSQQWQKVSNDVSAFKHVRQELSVANGVILRGTRIVIPETLRNKIVTLAHSGHQGIVKTKCLLRESVWFPGMDRMVEEMVSQCIPCQAANHSPLP
ncbi:uncharacterized protein K02A2.6-like [Acropora millepora]|uniref:uncharacterized protein K02A2.6-like n=1 Tax=Acropora millepora TaxID=45264 RepID=UPI001CF3D34B|nr:uncharacterized protein K02A2.6-like [Acropora millepora]